MCDIHQYKYACGCIGLIKGSSVRCKFNPERSPGGDDEGRSCTRYEVTKDPIMAHTCGLQSCDDKVAKSLKKQRERGDFEEEPKCCVIL